jgi:hypothetical protein
MGIAEAAIIVLGLTLFEIISSIDNAVVNADVLTTMSNKARHWFLFYGILFAVFIVRGLLPLLIVWLSSPELGLWGAVTATFSSDPHVTETIEATAPVLLTGGGIYLALLFFHWLFMEKKEYSFFLERHLHQNWSFWFYAAASVLLLVVVWLALKIDGRLAFGAVVGSTAFFITNGFKSNAEEAEKRLLGGHLSDVSKILYLEILDTTFSIDGVLGAFAFTVSIPLILLGNGLGALVVRYVTIHGIKWVKRYRFLKNGAMYSIAALGFIMLTEGLGHHVYTWLPSAITFVVVGIFFWLSKKELQMQHLIKA